VDLSPGGGHFVFSFKEIPSVYWKKVKRKARKRVHFGVSADAKAVEGKGV
jgi:hypothetical protein